MRTNIVLTALVCGTLALPLQSGAVDFMHTAPKETRLSEVEAFHGHLGPYAVLGARIGDMAIKRLEAERFAGILVNVRCPAQPPFRCIIDGLQVATGATFGKDNIRHFEGDDLQVCVIKNHDLRALKIRLKPVFLKELKSWADKKVDLAEQSRRAAVRPLEEMIEVEEYRLPHARPYC